MWRSLAAEERCSALKESAALSSFKRGPALAECGLLSCREEDPPPARLTGGSAFACGQPSFAEASARPRPSRCQNGRTPRAQIYPEKPSEKKPKETPKE